MRLLLFLLFPVLMLACTPYQSELGSEDGGYAEQRISENNYLVSFSGNGFTSHTRAYDFVRLRALEIGSELGYRYMVIQGAESAHEEHQVTTYQPTYSTTSGMVGGNSVHTTTVSQTPTTHNVSKPKYYLNVLYYTDYPPGKFLKDAVVEIDTLITELKQHYKID